MAVRNNNKKQAPGSQAIVIFWLIFIIVIISVFMLNAETIKKNFNLFKTRMGLPPGAGDELLVPDDEYIEEVVIEQPQRVVPEPLSITTEPEVKPSEPTPAPAVQPSQPTQPQTQTQVQPQPQTPAPTPPVQTRDRAVYFTQVNNDGQILQSKTTRRLPVTQSPMMDALNVLLAGPSAEEISRGLINLIPPNTRIVSATVRGSTAYINFSEDFLFNTFGVEGYVAQLRQIVWTVTEFSNISDVQILIEGRRLDYLGEGIWIGSPISRQSF